MKDLDTYMWKKNLNSVNYHKWSQQSKISHYEALKTIEMLRFPALF